jgi:uncharacterized phage protein (TIGR02220 family)
MEELEETPKYLHDLCNLFDLRPASLFSNLLFFIVKLKDDNDFIEKERILSFLKMGNFSFSQTKMREYLNELVKKGPLKEKSPHIYTVTKLIPSFENMKKIEGGLIAFDFNIRYSGGKRHLDFNILDTQKEHPPQKNKSDQQLKRKVQEESIIKDTIEYLNSQTHKNFKFQTAATKKLIAGRLKEGHTFLDFKKVIDQKVSEWAYDPEMAKYLRPATLFCPSKFESYLNENDSTSSLVEEQQNKSREAFREALRQKANKEIF